MKVFICLLAIAALAQANIDYDKYKPRNINRFGPRRPSFNGNNRIVGGEEATPHQFPNQAALLIETSQGSFFCGGSLISPKYVLTAAHCVDGASSVEVILGAHKFRQNEPTQVRLTSKNAYPHEKWDPSAIRNDIGIVVLPEAVTLNENIQVARLPTRSDASETFAGETGTVSGWGLDSDQSSSVSEVLRFTSSDIITNRDCDNFYGIIQDQHICLNGKKGHGSCNGDSGGPMIIKDGTQVGIVSFGSAFGCEMGYPSAYTRVTAHLDWIQKNSDVVIE